MLRATLVVLALLFGAPRAGAQVPIRDGAFVRAEGTRFTIEGRALHVIGANVSVMHGRELRSRARETLEAAARDGLSIVRLWALGEYPAGAPSWTRDYAFRAGPDGWIEESFVHLDHMLAEARRLGLRVIVVLANRWGDYGGIPAYLRWEGLDPPERHLAAPALTSFWESAASEARYREHVRRVVGRVSTSTGRPYSEDPTIFAWELVNEAEAAGVAGEAALLRWIERQASFVRELDGAHMISAGHIGYARLRDRSLWARACALAGVSYCDSHAYPLREGRLRTADALARWIDDRVQLAHHVVGKPLLFGEIGVPAEQRRVHGRYRARWLAIFLGRVLAGGAAGALLWTYLPSEARPRAYAVYAHGERESQTIDLRRALARSALSARRRAPRSTNPRVRPRSADTLLFDPIVTLRGRGIVHDAWAHDASGASLRLDPLDFERARFEAAGTWPGTPGLPHVYGSGAGALSYRFRGPGGAPTSLTVRLRVSSELPGAGAGVSAGDTSTLTISIDGVELGTVVAPPDDGLGAWVELEIQDAPELRALTSRAVHRLVISASDAGAGGVCVYGATETGEPAGITLRWR